MRLWHLLSGFLLSVGLIGCGAPSLLITPVSNQTELRETTVRPGKGWGGKKIALIEIDGMLVNSRESGLLQPGENPLSLFTQQLELAENDSSVAAVVLRVNSPGGTVTASDTMYQLLMRYKKRTGKPLVASAQEVAASGGYYVCCAADKIVVQSTSVLGSIGVLFTTFDFEGTMGKIGMRANTIKSGDMKDIGSPLRALRPEERQVMQNMVDEYFARFRGVVGEHRNVSNSQMFDGRVCSGMQAVQWGLADRTGLLDDALDLAAAMAGAPQAKVVRYSRPYGYGGSIYAAGPHALPSANAIQLTIPVSRAALPTGFYYLWQPGEN